MSSSARPDGFPPEALGQSSVVALVKIRFFSVIASIGGAAIFCWAWADFSVRSLAVEYRWNELIFSAIAVIVLYRRSFPLAVGTAIFACVWIVAAFLWMDKILP